MKDKIQDLISATKGAIGEVLVEDAVPMLAEEMLKGTVLEVTSGAVGMLSPRIGGVMIAYQQRRWERNWENYISLIYERQNEFNERLEKLDDEMRQKFNHKFFPLVSDFVPNEKQEEKIEMIVNGLINIAAGVNGQDDIILMYYETLNQLSLLDLRILRLYGLTYLGNGDGDDIWKVMQDNDIDDSQTKLIREKLERLGLIRSRNDEKLEENMKNVMQYVEDFSRGKKNLKLKRLNSIPRSESYKITSFGLKFIKFFIQEYSFN